MENATATQCAEGIIVNKFSRYRSLRKTVPQSPPASYLVPPEVPSPVTPVSSPPLRRIPSRYRNRTEPALKEPTTPPVPALPFTPAHAVSAVSPVARPSRYKSPQAERIPIPNRSVDHVQHVTSNGLDCPGARSHRSPISSPTTGPLPSFPISPLTQYEHTRDVSPDAKSKAEAREEARMILEGEYDRLQQLKQVQAQRDRALQKSAGIKKSVNELEHSNHRQVIPGNRQHQSPSLPSKFPTFQMVDAPNLKKKISRPALPSPGHAQIATTQKIHNPPNSSNPKTSDRGAKVAIPHRTAITNPTSKPDTFDAPVSAVNSGERRVTVRCNNSIITLPVNPTTTVRDIINSASICMSENINPRTTVLVEAFSEGGLERNLRNYERIRDVLNSWQNDTYNHLLVVTTKQQLPAMLESKDTPMEQPAGTCLQLHVSSQPRKWDKRWLTLQQCGQITVSKDQRGSGATNICHLSDFDVYMPTALEVKKTKPPKKFCLTIKSQQKAAMFLNGVNYIHHFCCNDLRTFEQWQNAVQTWRSWYLVNILGEGTSTSKPDTVTEPGPSLGKSSHPAEAIAYQLGSFTPLLDFKDLGASRKGSRDQSDTASHSSRERPAWKPLLDFSEKSEGLGRKLSTRHSIINNDIEPISRQSEDTSTGFTGSGLLARSASRRSQGGRPSGRGVPGVKGKPLLELAPVSEFTAGSLLRNIEVNNTSPEVKIDRGKRIEASVPVGEGQ